MNDQERQIITDIFHRLEGTAGQARDADAERFIADKVRTQPYAPYAMAQALYVQEEAMKSLNQQLEQLKAENAELKQHASSGGGGIFSSIFGGGSRPQQPPSFSRPGQPQGGYAPQQGGPWGGAPQPAPQGGPWGGQQGYGQQGGYAQPQAAGGGGFLRGALTTAAGVAGGMVVGNALMNAFSGGHHQTLGGFSGADMSSMGFSGSDMGGGFGGGDAGGYQNASFGDGGNAFDEGGGSSSDASFQDASFDDGGSDFGGGGDSGGGDDSSWS